MKRTIVAASVVLAGALGLGSTASAAELAAQDAQVTVRSVVVRDGNATGVVVNDSDLVVRNPRVLIRHSWLWANEFDPGTDNPGRSEIVTIPAEIQPGDSFTFTHAFPVPEVGDQRGRFETSGEIVGFEQVGRPSVSSIR